MQRIKQTWLALIVSLFIVCSVLVLVNTLTADETTIGAETAPTGDTGNLSLQVLNPRGVIQSAPIIGLTTPRVSDLNGKRIAILSEKEESHRFFDALEKLIKQKYPTATILRFGSPANPMVPDNTAEVAKECDVWLQGVKTSGSSAVDYDVKLEKLGRPGAPFCIDSLIKQRKRLAEVNGMPTLRIITIPSISYLGAEGDPEKMKLVAASVFDKTMQALTAPLTEEEKNPKPFVYDYGPLKFSGASYSEAVEKFQQYCVENYISDGLPVTPPTREAVEWMLSGTSRSRDEEIGIMAPRNGMATIEKIAINSVMAGAKPEYLPVIIAAIECLTDKNFNLYHITTTGDPIPIIWINGPIGAEIGMNTGIGYLGRGSRANSTIGRAVGLCMINIGWRLMDTDAGVIGRPEGFCQFTFPENEKESPWESFAVERGYKAEDSTVTITETMQFMLGPGGGMSSQSWKESLDRLVKMIQSTGSPLTNLFFGSANRRHEIALHPTFARQLAEAGFTKQSLAKWLHEKTSVAWDELNQDQKEAIKNSISLGLIPGLKIEDCKSGLLIESFTDPKHIAILVAGDAAGYTAFWSSPIGSSALQADSAPGIRNLPYMTKIIRGATLTKAGR
jgi:hypothetical protein